MLLSHLPVLFYQWVLNSPECIRLFQLIVMLGGDDSSKDVRI